MSQNAGKKTDNVIYGRPKKINVIEWGCEH